MGKVRLKRARKTSKKGQEAIRRMVVTNERKADSKEGKLKAEEIAKARSRPLSVASNIILREDKKSSQPDCTMADVIEKKYGSKPKTPDDIQRWKRTNRAIPRPELAYPGSVAD